MLFNKGGILQTEFNCVTCRKRNCSKKRKKVVAYIECICKIRERKKCKLCKKGLIKTYTCPAATPPEIDRIYPYFITWLNSNFTVYPDHRGQYFVDKRLKEAFLLLLDIKQYYEDKKRAK